MQKKADKLALDINRYSGRIKPLHGVNNCPIRFGEEKIPEFESAGIPFVRTHDSGGPYGRGTLIDIPNIFRDFDADPDDPASYDFAFTDIYLRNLVNSGCKIFYRLGITIENFYAIKAYRTAPPKDFKKWARICEGVIRQYNHGWAGGFHYGIEYWEIWNEPENPPMWSGSMEEYFKLYSTTAKHLKKQFPEIKVGGYASCGFYAVTRDGMNDFYRSFITWFDEFLIYAKKERAPLDFYSWHLYTSDLDELITHAEYVTKKLRKAGFDRTENIFNEWNYIDKTAKGYAKFDSMKEIPAALFIAGAFCRMQDSPIDKAMYYDAEPSRTYCGLFYFPSQRVTPAYYAFKTFNELYKLRNRIECSGIRTRNIFTLAAADEHAAAAMLVNSGKAERKIELETSASLKKAEITLLDKEHSFSLVKSLLRGHILTLPQESILLLRIPLKEKTSGTGTHSNCCEPEKENRQNFAGLAG